MRYFISGHGWLTQEQFEKYYVPVLDNILYGAEDESFDGDPDPWFVIGDFKGVDIMAQQYIVDAGIGDRLIVYHMFEKPRNLAVSKVYQIKTIGGFKSDEERDAAMTANSDFDIAFIFRKNSGTERNIKRRYLKLSDTEEK